MYYFFSPGDCALAFLFRFKSSKYFLYVVEYTFSNDQDTGDIPSQPANNDVKRGNVIRDHHYTSASSTFQNY